MFNEIYFFVLNEKNPDLIKARFQGRFPDLKQSNYPFLSISGVLASQGLDDKVMVLQELGVSVNAIVQGYAFAGNHSKVEEYRVQHNASVHFIAKSYALAGNHGKVKEYRKQHNASVDDIAYGYALAGNHSKVEKYRLKYNASVNVIAKGYVFANNHSKVEEYRLQHNALVDFIALSYALAGNHSKVEEYRVLHNASVDNIVYGYALAGNHSKVEEYRMLYNAAVADIIRGYLRAGNHSKVEEYRCLQNRIDNQKQPGFLFSQPAIMNVNLSLLQAQLRGQTQNRSMPADLQKSCKFPFFEDTVARAGALTGQELPFIKQEADNPVQTEKTGFLSQGM